MIAQALDDAFKAEFALLFSTLFSNIVTSTDEPAEKFAAGLECLLEARAMATRIINNTPNVP